MFLRGVLKVGDGGPEIRANKQVAGGTRWEAYSELRQATKTTLLEEGNMSEFSSSTQKHNRFMDVKNT